MGRIFNFGLLQTLKHPLTHFSNACYKTAIQLEALRLANSKTYLLVLTTTRTHPQPLRGGESVCAKGLAIGSLRLLRHIRTLSYCACPQ